MSHVIYQKSTTRLLRSLPLKHHVLWLASNTLNSCHIGDVHVVQYAERNNDGGDHPKTTKIRKNMETPYKPRMIDKRSLEDGGLKHAHTEHRPSFSTHHPLGSTMPPIHSTQHHGNQSQFSLFKCDYQKTLGENCGNMHMKLNVFSLSTTVYVPIVNYCVNPCQAPLPILMDSPVYGARQPQRDICIQYLILSPPTVMTFFSLLAMLSTRLAHTLFGTR